jgi:hypothetical protein
VVRCEMPESESTDVECSSKTSKKALFIEDVKEVEAGACFLPAKFWTSSPHGEVVQSEEEED